MCLQRQSWPTRSQLFLTLKLYSGQTQPSIRHDENSMKNLHVHIMRPYLRAHILTRTMDNITVSPVIDSHYENSWQ